MIIDAGDEIFDEYRHLLSMKGQPGVGDKFMKWVHDNRWNLPDSQRVPIARNGDSYDEFPPREDLSNFDLSDRKFIAVANATAQKWPILQAADSKWWDGGRPLTRCACRIYSGHRQALVLIDDQTKPSKRRQSSFGLSALD
ncbi:MAG: hypothetical protein ACKOB4_12305 [Acidobacteriota bacterium]